MVQSQEMNDTFAAGIANIAISGDTIVIGAQGSSNPLVEGSHNLSGAVYIYQKDGNDWTQVSRISKETPETADFFGVSVDIKGDTIVVGSKDGGDNAGAVYIIEKSGDTWLDGVVDESYRIDPPERHSSAKFGLPVALSEDGNTILAGEYSHEVSNIPSRIGRVHVFEKLVSSCSGVRADCWEHKEIIQEIFKLKSKIILFYRL